MLIQSSRLILFRSDLKSQKGREFKFAKGLQTILPFFYPDIKACYIIFPTDYLNPGIAFTNCTRAY